MTDAEELVEAKAKLRRQEPLVMVGAIVFELVKWGSAIFILGALFALYQNVAHGASLDTFIGNVAILALSGFVCWKLCRWEDRNPDV